MGSRGSEWSKWDLHVHTPASLVHNYPGTDPWPAFLDDLEALPSELKVIGINDYLFLDGYRRVLQEKANGRLANIALVLPVIELRIPQFGGTNSNWSRVNLHVIFDPCLTSDEIQDYFLAALVRHYQLSPEATGKGLEWRSHPTRQTLEDLGKAIVESVPLERRGDYGPALIEGFNNLNIPIEQIEDALKHHMLAGRALLAVGKTEWADMKWQDGHIAEKKNTINKVDFVFTAAERPANALKARDRLKEEAVNARLLDCSDAHWLSSAVNKDRIGMCATWIKGDHTFRALRYARLEYENRVFIGDMPTILSRIARAPGKFIDEVRIAPSAACPPGKEWFSSSLKLNPEMACLIGNKGSGKSAFLDIVGLVGNSKNSESFSFLRADRFRKKPLNPSRWFDAELRWHDGRVSTCSLSNEIDASRPEDVRYLPQSYLEGICNEVGGHEEGRLDRELKRIIFECLPDESRLECEGLDDLIVELGREYEGRMGAIRASLSALNRQIAELEPLELPIARTQIVAAIVQQQERITSHEATRPASVPSPYEDPALGEQLQALGRQLEEQNSLARGFENEIQSLKSELAKLEKRANALRRLRAKIQDVEIFVQTARTDAEALIADAEIEIDLHSLLIVNTNVALVDGAIESLASRKSEVVRLLSPENADTPAYRLAKNREEASAITSQMSEPLRLFVLFQEQLVAWEKAKGDLVGSESTEGSLLWLKRQLYRIEAAPEALTKLYESRLGLVRQLADALIALKEGLRQLYGPAQDALEVASDTGVVPIKFDLELEARGFANRFLECVHLGVRSGYQGQESAARTVEDLVTSTDFGDAGSVASFVDALLVRLRYADESNEERVSVVAVLKGGRSVEEVYDLVSHLSFVVPVFRLMFDGKSISVLSPGQRGMVLLLFYLLIDPEDIPLLVDQPEENLDNQTVASYLTNAFRVARARRQVLVVTHNANLAVVCDADQIILCQKVDDRFAYQSRPLEEIEAVEQLLDILEGTRRAFDVRGTKYRN